MSEREERQALADRLHMLGEVMEGAVMGKSHPNDPSAFMFWLSKQNAADVQAAAALLRGQQVEQTESQPANRDGDVPGQARAWLAVCDLLDELEVPRFSEETAREGALRAILELHAGQAAPARQQDEADAAWLWGQVKLHSSWTSATEAIRAAVRAEIAAARSRE